MDIKQLARSLGVTQQLAISRATELLRLLKLRVPGSLGQVGLLLVLRIVHSAITGALGCRERFAGQRCVLSLLVKRKLQKA